MVYWLLLILLYTVREDCSVSLTQPATHPPIAAPMLHVDLNLADSL